MLQFEAWAHRKYTPVLAKHYKLLKEDKGDATQWICAKFRGDSNNKCTMNKKADKLTEKNGSACL